MNEFRAESYFLLRVSDTFRKIPTKMIFACPTDEIGQKNRMDTELV